MNDEEKKNHSISESWFAMSDVEEENDDGENDFFQLYASLMVLLMTFFIVIYSFSTQSQAKFELARHSLSKVFKSLGLSSTDEIISILSPQKKLSDKVVERHRQLLISLAEIENNIAQELNGCAVDIRPDETIIHLDDDKLYKTGSYELLDEGCATLDKIVAYIQKNEYEKICIDDCYSVHDVASSLNSQWTISSMRSMIIADYFSEKGIPEAVLIASGRICKDAPADKDENVQESVHANEIKIIIKKHPLRDAEQRDLYVAED